MKKITCHICKRKLRATYVDTACCVCRVFKEHCVPRMFTKENYVPSM